MLQILPSYGRKVGVFDISCGLLVTGSTDRTIEVRREGNVNTFASKGLESCRGKAGSHLERPQPRSELS